MTTPNHLQGLHESLRILLAEGMPDDPIEHARQVAEVAGILHAAFAAEGFAATLVGGSAIEIHAPGIYVSGDMDIVIEKSRETATSTDEIFDGLGFRRIGRHRRFRDLFIKLVPGPVAGPVQEVRVGRSEFRIVKKEVPLRDRIVGFKHWKYTAYGQQAIDMLAAFGDELDESWLIPELRREDALDALEALKVLAESSTPISDELLRDVIDSLHRRGPTQ